MTCKFEIHISSINKFQCAVKFGPDGWAYLWSHKEEWTDPCVDCPFYVEGQPYNTFYELKPYEFYDISGKMISETDWERIEDIKCLKRKS